MSDYWTVPALWPGETVAIIGGGPSLTKDQVEYCRHKARVIAINNAYQLAPWAEVHYFCDERWYRLHRDRTDFKEVAGLKVTMTAEGPGLRKVRNDGDGGLCLERDGVRTGRNSGYQCINLAVHLGFTRILLLGFDMRVRPDVSHWFGEHPWPSQPGDFKIMLGWFPTIVKPLKALGVEVINCTPGSALTVFPNKPLTEVLCPARSA